MTGYDKVPHANGLRLHLNENTGGCSPAVLAALRSIGREEISLYPDYAAVTAAAARWLDVDPAWIKLTNGLDEGLHVVAQYAATHRPTLLRRSKRRTANVLIVDPAFEMYAACAEAAGLSSLHLPPEPDFRFPIDGLLAAATDTTRLIYLTDPNNPTGLAIPAGLVERLAAAVPHATVFVDEAYADFSGRTLIGPALERHRNLVIGRTFAKAHGLAALRIGAIIAHPDTLAPLAAILPPYSLNVCAVRALEAALGDRAFLDEYVAQSAESRRRIYAFCDTRAFPYWPSEANFVLVRIGPQARDIVGALADRGILIRDRSAAPGCGGCVRITAGIVEHTEICLAALEDVLAQRID